MPSLSAWAVRHVAFEDLGSLRAPLEAAGYAIHTLDAGVDDLAALDPLAPDLLVVLGGPIGACDDEAYPLIVDELRLVRSRLGADRPLLGICLGAQLMARALGARVHPGPAKEIGWAPIMLTQAGEGSVLRDLAGAPVLHWHGDTFDLPPGCERLASTELYPNQAFARGARALALQFHVEAEGAGFERWLIGHAAEIASAGLDPSRLRADAQYHGTRLPPLAAKMMTRWLEGLSHA